MKEPKPTITWRREDGKSIFRDNENHPSQGGVPIHHGEDLHLQVLDTSSQEESKYIGEDLHLQVLYTSSQEESKYIGEDLHLQVL